MNPADPNTWSFLADEHGLLMVRPARASTPRRRVPLSSLFEDDGRLCVREPSGALVAVVPVRTDPGSSLANPPPTDLPPPFHTLSRSAKSLREPAIVLTEPVEALPDSVLREGCPHLQLFCDPAYGGPPPSRVHVRGTQLLHPQEAWHTSYRSTDCAPRYAFGGVFIRPENAVRHFLFMGLPETGKTTLIRTLLTSALHHRAFHPDYTPRALVFDAKGDMYPFLERLRPGQVVLLNPFDARSFAWDIAADLTDRAELEYFANSIVPPKDDEDNKNRYFSSTARMLLVEILVALRKFRGANWSLRDLVLAAHPPDLVKLLSRTQSGQRALGAQLAIGKQFRASTDDVLSTVGTYIRPLETVAAAWESSRRAGRTFSFRTWVNTTGYILVLGYDPIRNAAIEPLNRHFLRAAHAFIFRGRPDMKLPDTWIVLDELALAPTFNELHDLLIAGRQFGAAVVAAFQSKPDLVTHFDGDEVRVRGIIDVCQNLAMFRMGTQSAALASELAGQQEVVAIIPSASDTYTRNRGRNISNSQGGSTGIGRVRNTGVQSPGGGYFDRGYADELTNGGPPTDISIWFPTGSNLGLGSSQNLGLTEQHAVGYQTGESQADAQSQQHAFSEVRNIPPDLFVNMPGPDPDTSLPGVFRSPDIGLWSAYLDSHWVYRHTAEPTQHETFVPRSETELEYLPSWAPEERDLILGDPSPLPPFSLFGNSAPAKTPKKKRKEKRGGLNSALFEQVGTYRTPRRPRRAPRTPRATKNS